MNINRITKISILTAIICILSLLSIQIGTVPVTLQNLGVFLSGFILGPIDGAISIIIYILLGAAGLPVFAGGTSGFKTILGPTGGYLLSFPMASFICGCFSSKYNSKKSFFIAGLLSIIVIYIIGIPYLSLMAHIPLSKAMIIGAYPFIVPDIIKMIIGAFLGFIIKSRLLKENLIRG